jgi:hypothetical protein
MFLLVPLPTLINGKSSRGPERRLGGSSATTHTRITAAQAQLMIRQQQLRTTQDNGNTEGNIRQAHRAVTAPLARNSLSWVSQEIYSECVGARMYISVEVPRFRPVITQTLASSSTATDCCDIISETTAPSSFYHGAISLYTPAHMSYRILWGDAYLSD